MWDVINLEWLEKRNNRRCYSNFGQTILIFSLWLNKFLLVLHALQGLSLKLPYPELQITYNISDKYKISAYLLRIENPLFSTSFNFKFFIR